MKPVRVILADNHQVMLQGLTELLAPTCTILASVSDARSLVSAVEEAKPDVVVVDVSLPNDIGQGVVRRLRGRYPDLKIILVSVYDEDTIVEKAFSSGACAFVLKRSVASDLIPAIESALENRRYLSPALTRDELRQTPC